MADRAAGAIAGSGRRNQYGLGLNYAAAPSVGLPRSLQYRARKQAVD